MGSKYHIKVKRDFGSGPGYWLPNGASDGSGGYGFVKRGFVVTKNGCNCIPGAGWFQTIEEAMRGIQAHIAVGDSQEWYNEYKRLKS